VKSFRIAAQVEQVEAEKVNADEMWPFVQKKTKVATELCQSTMCARKNKRSTSAESS
jgi:hypothetical protein